jgi:hypothetical protein
MFVHWTERQVLTTDNWVKVVGPLPKDDQVAAALSDYSVNKLFSGIQLEDKITQALPDRADFLAPVLTERLEIRTEDITKNIIQSDRFEAVWTTANRIGHQKLMDAARSDTANTDRLAQTDFGLKLSLLRDSIRERLGSSSDKLFADTSAQTRTSDVDINFSFKTKFENFKKFVKATDFLNGVLGLLAAAFLLAAMILAKRRRRLLMVLSLIVLVVALMQLIGVNAARPAILNHIQNESYRPAAGVVYDDLLDNFRHSATVVAFAGALIFIIAYLSQRRFISRNKFLAEQLRSYKRTKLYKSWKKLRQQMYRYKLHISGVVIVLGLTLIALVFELDWEGILRAVLIMTIVIELVFLLARSGRRASRT